MYRQSSSSQNPPAEQVLCVGLAIFSFFLCTYLPFIIADFIFASEGSQCVTTHVTGISFTLQGWLEVDAYVRIIILAIILLAVFSLLTSFGVFVLSCTLCFLVIYSLFSLAWTIVGAVLFWGKLAPLGVCYGSVSVYMNALLIISFVLVWCNCFCNRVGGTQR